MVVELVCAGSLAFLADWVASSTLLWSYWMPACLKNRLALAFSCGVPFCILRN